MPQLIKTTNLRIKVINNQLNISSNLRIKTLNQQVSTPSILKVILGRYNLIKSTNFRVKALEQLKVLSSILRIKVIKANIQFYDGDGVAELASIFDIFSGTQIARGTTSAGQTFRVYNNYSGAQNISHANDVRMYISGDDEFLTEQVEKQEIFDFTRELILGGYVEIRCVLASETGLTPPSGSVYRPLVFGTAFEGTGFDTIISSGAYNYNEYQMRFNIPASGMSGSWNASGTAYPSIFVDYSNEGFAVDS